MHFFFPKDRFAAGPVVPMLGTCTACTFKPERQQLLFFIAAVRLPVQLQAAEVRQGCEPLQQLAHLIGSSSALHTGIVALCENKLKEAEGVKAAVRMGALCMLRGQLLMALHDKGQIELCNEDPCYLVGWEHAASLSDYHRTGLFLVRMHGQSTVVGYF